VTRATSPFSVELVQYPVATLQLRSARTGRVIATLLHSLGGTDAVMTGSGSVIAVVDYGCRSQVLRIDPRTGHVSLIRVLPQDASSVALSPDGRELAYLTWPGPAGSCFPDRQPTSPVREEINPGGPAAFSQNVVALVNLSTGTTVRAATSNTEDPLTAPAWSPDGTAIAVTDMGDSSIVLLSATRPDFGAAPRIGALSP
jgi:dipeptidyl aminopeptidase/acylaminoacyl peptidase